MRIKVLKVETCERKGKLINETVEKGKTDG